MILQYIDMFVNLPMLHLDTSGMTYTYTWAVAYILLIRVVPLDVHTLSLPMIAAERDANR